MEKNKENVVYCMNCGNEMILDDVVERDSMVYHYHCPHCGIIEECYECTEENRSDYPYYSNDKGIEVETVYHSSNGCICPICGNITYCDGNSTYCEIFGMENECELNEYGCPVDDSLASEMFCPNCGASCTIIEPLPSQMHLYSAYAEDNE